MPARTIMVAESENFCEVCLAEGINPPHKLKAQIDTDSDGIAQRLSMKCDKHGHTKELFSARPDPVFKKLFPCFFEDQFGPIAPEPKPTRWV